MSELYALCDNMLAARSTVTADTTSDHNDLLSLLAAAGNEEDGTLDADEVREQVLIFLLAGHETTAKSMAFTLHLLARHPGEQSRIRAEIIRVLGDRMPTDTDLGRLPRLTQAFKEAMRLYPPGPVLARRAVEATEIAGSALPAGANVIVAPWVTHRDPDLWENPERFDPDRFSPEREAERHRYAWFPFGGGPRTCIGQHFAMLESVLGLAVLLRSHELEAIDEVVPVAADITLQATGPARVRLNAI
ncbi:cytochrome P450 [Streptomyces sp. YS-3]|uniref:cytochrome P450 n=1 Tax=Streptomyces sp. YS-3 TaxID=3381352 RepID=UPI0038641D74